MLDVKEQIFTVDITKNDKKKWFSCKVKLEKISFAGYMAALQEGKTEVERNLAVAKRSNVTIENYPDIGGHKITTISDIFELPAEVVTQNPDHIAASMKLLRAITAKVTMGEETEKN